MAKDLGVVIIGITMSRTTAEKLPLGEQLLVHLKS